MAEEDDARCGACSLCTQGLEVTAAAEKALPAGGPIKCAGHFCKDDGQLDRDAECYCVGHTMALCSLCLEHYHPEDEVQLCLNDQLTARGLYMVSHGEYADDDEEEEEDEAQVATSPDGKHAVHRFEETKAQRLAREEQEKREDETRRILEAEGAYVIKAGESRTVEEQRKYDLALKKAEAEARVKEFESKHYDTQAAATAAMEMARRQAMEADIALKEEVMNQRQAELLSKRGALSEFEQKKQEEQLVAEKKRLDDLKQKEAELYDMTSAGIAAFEQNKKKLLEEENSAKLAALKQKEQDNFKKQKTAMSAFEEEVARKKQEEAKKKEEEAAAKQKALIERQTAAAKQKEEEKRAAEKAAAEKKAAEEAEKERERKRKARALEIFDYGKKWKTFNDDQKAASLQERFGRFEAKLRKVDVAAVVAFAAENKLENDQAKAVYLLEDRMEEELAALLKREEEERVQREKEERERAEREAAEAQRRKEEEAAAKRKAEQEAVEAAKKAAEASAAPAAGAKAGKAAGGKAAGAQDANAQGAAKGGCCIVM